MTVIEIIQDERFAKYIDGKVQFYNSRPLPTKGMAYRRTPFDTLIEKGLFTSESIIDEFIQVVEKRSKLSSSVRSAVEQLGYQAIHHVRQMEKEKKV
ncbi:MAG: hypothetical protein ACK5M3_19670 [Dysgonomonas sp.]